MSLPEKPFSRKEQYLAKIAGEDTEIPEKPFSREEMYLDVIAQGGGGGGGYVLPIASADTLGGVKVGDNLSIDANGVLSAQGSSGGTIKTLTADDFNYPESNPDGVALWLLPAGIYQLKGIKFYLASNRYDYDGSPMTIIINPHEVVGDVVLFSFGGQYTGMQVTNDLGADAGFYAITMQ